MEDKSNITGDESGGDVGNSSNADASTEKNESSSVNKGYPLTVTDMLGKTVKLEKKPQKIAVISGKLLDLFHSVGGTSICSVEPEDGNTAADSAEQPPTVGKASNPDIIEILELEPDLVFAEAGLQNGVVSILQKNGIPVIALKADDQNNMQETVRIMKEVAGIN